MGNENGITRNKNHQNEFNSTDVFTVIFSPDKSPQYYNKRRRQCNLVPFYVIQMNVLNIERIGKLIICLSL
jgi:hypothetical protein